MINEYVLMAVIVAIVVTFLLIKDKDQSAGEIFAAATIGSLLGLVWPVTLLVLVVAGYATLLKKAWR